MTRPGRKRSLPDEEFEAEPNDYHNFEIVEGRLDLLLVLVVLDGRNHTQAETHEHSHEPGGKKCAAVK